MSVIERLKYIWIMLLLATHFLANCFCSIIAQSDNDLWWYLRIPIYSLQFSLVWIIIYSFVLKNEFFKYISIIGIVLCVTDAIDKFSRIYGWTTLDSISMVVLGIVIIYKWFNGEFDTKRD